MPCVKTLRFQQLVFFVSNLLLKDKNLFNFNEQGIKKNIIFLSNDSQNILKEYSHVLKNEIVLTFVYIFSMRRRKSHNILKSVYCHTA